MSHPHPIVTIRASDEAEAITRLIRQAQAGSAHRRQTGAEERAPDRGFRRRVVLGAAGGLLLFWMGVAWLVGLAVR